MLKASSCLLQFLPAYSFMQFSSFYYFLNYCSLFAALLPLFAAVWHWKKIHEVTRPFFYFFYSVIFSEAFSYLVSRYSINTAWWNTIYFFVETIFFWWWLHQWLFKGRSKAVLISAMVVFSSYWGYSTVWLSGIFQVNAFARTIECLIIASYSAAILIQLAKRNEPGLFNNPKFWLASGAMLYFSFGVFVFSIYKVTADNEYAAYVFEPIWNVHSAMNIISNLLYSIAFLCPLMTYKFPSRR